ncbi:phosphate acyltransferase [Shigella sonnei]
MGFGFAAWCAADGGTTGGYRACQRENVTPSPGEEPRMAMLSFSSNGSAITPALPTSARRKSSVTRTKAGCRWRVAVSTPPSCRKWRRKKRLPSPFTGEANVMVFPSLEAEILATKNRRTTWRISCRRAIDTRDLPRDANLSRGLRAGSTELALVAAVPRRQK